MHKRSRRKYEEANDPKKQMPNQIKVPKKDLDQHHKRDYGRSLYGRKSKSTDWDPFGLCCLEPFKLGLLLYCLRGVLLSYLAKKADMVF